ncbi:PREDICTED: glandular kallikrein-3, submandibular-like [Diuraphis noxia]|uniref:glandular kallikrein-3, submandibular-like n=1 Tax=Diuraphis noxia TaxID=143948 RepID=UPI000763962C|nr:PREDICTED: glandular kallikrein-3, submandibular-like [Diuraphis noxia]
MGISIILLLLIIMALFEHLSTFHFNNGLIYNGEIFNSDKYPYIMFLKFKNGPKSFSGCTGSLIQKLFVLTAAHCCHGHEEIDVEVSQGSPLIISPIHKVAKIHQHEDYNPKVNVFAPQGDICVLQLEEPFSNITTFMKYGGSPKDFDDGKKLSCAMFGFGRTGDNKTKGKSGYMMTNDVVHGEKACKLYETDEIKKSWKQYLCLVPNGQSTTCRGDSGGPMMCGGIQYGVCSFGFPYEKGVGGCGLPNQQEIYTFIFYYLNWLDKIVKPNEKKEKKKKKKKKKRSSGNLLKPHHTLHIILTILLCNMLTFI